MNHAKHKIFSLGLSIAFMCGIWQLTENKLADFWGKACYSLSGHSFMEINTKDKTGFPLRYYPTIGKVIDPQYVARETSRNYATRIDPQRLKAFLSQSEWLLAQLDSTGQIAQNYDFAKAGKRKPWYSPSTQSASMVALANRAGHLREPDTFAKAQNLLKHLQTYATKDKQGGIWFQEFDNEHESLKGMLNTLVDLGNYQEMVGDSLSAKLFKQGTIALANRLPLLTKHGFLEDKFFYKNQRSEHIELSNLLAQVNAATPDSIFKPTIISLKQNNNRFILLQLLQSPRFGRIIGFLLPCALVYLFVYWLIKPKGPKTAVSL